MPFNWESEETSILLNPRLPSSQSTLFDHAKEHLQHLQGHIVLATSGTASAAGMMPKLAALSKKAILVSAEAVNRHLQINSQDRWINPLPSFHVGGLGINARAYLSNTSVIPYSEKWNPHNFVKEAEQANATLTALVPTQVYDLVFHQLPSPQSLRAVIVGGGALPLDLYERGKALGWKLLASYGLTECSSQVATSLSASDGALTVLSHVEVKVNSVGCICLKSDSLLTGYLSVREGEWTFIDPKVDGWFVTEDLGELRDGTLAVLGRVGDIVKVSGEKVNIQQLNALFDALKLDGKVEIDTAIVAVSDPRLGCRIELAVAGGHSKVIERLVGEFQAAVLPFERIRNIQCVDTIPRSPLGKVLVKTLLQKEP